ncbi:enoyl-CoA hydratase [Solimonas aquatica]|uniref:Enoyl-CoA hydratase n=1 Tax=Solimonas aquatica TaxID=489703 RepID=A0A1H9LUV9_9GAMM|nr:enoyl-CoA hydratase/isomerase family protein [Solimonas aquatica]SER15220.1 enoyl-CoA hydratase [Solimonas aquatica]
MSSPLLSERRDGVLVLTHQAAPWNRMGFAYMDALEAAVDEAARDPQVRALLLTAEGEANFSVGMDLKELLLHSAARGGAEAVLDQRLRVLRKIELLDKPSVVTLFGFCLGGGLELPLACHFRLAASEGAQIGLPELELGTVPAWGGSARLTRCVGRDRALDLILRRRKIDGAEALRIGLVHSLHPLAQLKSAAFELARELAAQPRPSVAGVLRCVVGAEHLPLADALAVERQAVLACRDSGNQDEGLHAFLDKRRPQFPVP